MVETKKQPALHMMIGDYFKDPLLSQASLTSRGAWSEILMYMWESDRRGELVTTPKRLIKLIRAESLDEVLFFLNELADLEFGDLFATDESMELNFPITFDECNTKVTLRNRRMYSEFKDRQNTRLRVRKHRETKKKRQMKQKGNTNVTGTLSISTSITKEYSVDFQKFWKEYPNKVSKKKSFEIWKKLSKTNQLPSIDIILNAIKKQKLWRKNANGEFRPGWKHPTTWLNQGCWDDECKTETKSNHIRLRHSETPDYLKGIVGNIGEKI